MSRATYQKLGIKEGDRVCVVDPPFDYFTGIECTFECPCDVIPKDTYAFMHLFAANAVALERSFLKMKACLEKSGMLWVSWPKKNGGIPSDLDGNLVREYGLSNGLVDVKKASINEDWSALKFVFRMRDRIE